MSRPRITLLLLFAASTVIAAASGPADRLPTDPKSVVSATHAAAEPVSVADLLQTRRIGGSTLSPDGAHIAYISNASGRLNLWQMNIDGSSAQQLLKSNDRQASPAFTRDGKEIVYMQDKGGDELYDLYAVPGSRRRAAQYHQHRSHQRSRATLFSRRKDARVRQQGKGQSIPQRRSDAVACRRCSPAYT